MVGKIVNFGCVGDAERDTDQGIVLYAETELLMIDGQYGGYQEWLTIIYFTIDGPEIIVKAKESVVSMGCEDYHLACYLRDSLRIPRPQY